MNSREWRIQLGYGHTLSRVDDGPRKGRIPREGYIRSCGLCVGNLTSLCSQDPEYRAARIVSDGRGGIDEHKLMNIFMLMTFFMSNTKGHIVEFGCYKGGSALFMAKLAARFMPETRVYAFDTFAGMPETDKAVDLHKAGDFSDVSVESVRELAQSAGLTNIEFIPGQFEDTAPDALARIGKIALRTLTATFIPACNFHTMRASPTWSMAATSFLTTRWPRPVLCAGGSGGLRYHPRRTARGASVSSHGLPLSADQVANTDSSPAFTNA